jgi:hypothetical protein
MSNLGGIAGMFDEDFLELSETHKRLKLINCSIYIKKFLIDAEISKKQIK